jgi:hypothetical protein
LRAPGGGAYRCQADSAEVLILEFFELFSQIFLRFTQFLLKSPEQLILFTLGKRQVIIAQLRVFLLQFAFYLVPPAFEL